MPLITLIEVLRLTVDVSCVDSDALADCDGLAELSLGVDDALCEADVLADDEDDDADAEVDVLAEVVADAD